ncbi:MAG: TRAP transporter large permease subunit [Candidatus Solibacter sp.]|nr:TRAP transporter large permease subunit [Candidatus Solibacter sp.]
MRRVPGAIGWWRQVIAAARFLGKSERSLAILAISVMSLLPVLELASRLLGFDGVPGSSVFVQHLTLWVAFLGASLTAAADRLLSLSANTLLPEKWGTPVRLFTSGLTASVALCLAWASLQFMLTQREGGNMLALGIPRWVALVVMPAGFLLIAARVIGGAGAVPARRPAHRWLAALGLLIPVALAFVPHPEGPALLWIGIPVIVVATFLGLPVFATLGGIALLLLWNGGMPVGAVPVELYKVVASPMLPSLPLFTLAGYLLVEGGASGRLLRVYTALFGWMPGGLTIATAVACAIFTFAGSGMTIVSMGGLLLPMLVKARYPENFSIGLIMPIILYGIYSKQAISTLFVGGLLPGLLMVALVCAWGVFQGVRHGAERANFSLPEARRAVWEAKWELALPVIVLVGLFGGLGTLVEAGAITVVYSFIVEWFVSREFSPRRDYGRVALECVIVVGGVLLIIGVAMGFTNYLLIADVPATLTAWVKANVHSKYVFLLLLNVVLLIKGSFMDVFSAIIVMVPLITPVAEGFGIDPVQLAIIFVANLELGYLTPPVGMNLCLSAYRFKKPMTAIYRATLPFYLILLLGVLLITYVPWLTTALVARFGG